MAHLDATPRCHKWIDKPISHRNQSFDLHCKLRDWFLYEMQPWVDMGQGAKFANHKQLFQVFPVGNYLFKVNNRKNRTRCEKCSKLNANKFHALF